MVKVQTIIMFRISKTAFVMSFFTIALAAELSHNKHVCHRKDADDLLQTLRHQVRAHNSRNPSFRELVLGEPNPRRVPIEHFPFAKSIHYCNDRYSTDRLPNEVGDVSHLFPRIVLMRHRLKPSFMCGGIFISSTWILASAHCLRLGFIVNFYSYGYYDWDTYSDTYKIFIHPRFDPQQDFYDVGLVKVSRRNSRLRQPCTPDPKADIPDGAHDACVGFRWVRTVRLVSGKNVAQYDLQHAYARIYHVDEQFMYFVSDRYGHNFATWEGPVVCKVIFGATKLVGVMSHAHCKTRRGGHLPAATRISRYLEWISSTIENN